MSTILIFFKFYKTPNIFYPIFYLKKKKIFKSEILFYFLKKSEINTNKFSINTCIVFRDVHSTD